MVILNELKEKSVNFLVSSGIAEPDEGDVLDRCLDTAYKSYTILAKEFETEEGLILEKEPPIVPDNSIRSLAAYSPPRNGSGEAILVNTNQLREPELYPTIPAVMGEEIAHFVRWHSNPSIFGVSEYLDKIDSAETPEELNDVKQAKKVSQYEELDGSVHEFFGRLGYNIVADEYGINREDLSDIDLEINEDNIEQYENPWNIWFNMKLKTVSGEADSELYDFVDNIEHFVGYSLADELYSSSTDIDPDLINESALELRDKYGFREKEEEIIKVNLSKYNS